MPDKRAYCRMDVGYLSNPKVAALLEDHPRAILLHFQCIAYSAQHMTDGKVPMRLAMRLACAEQCDLDLLLQYGLLQQLNDTTVLVHDYLEHQRSADEIQSASDKAQRAATARWNNAPSNAPSMPSAVQEAMPIEKIEKRNKERASAAADGEFETFWQLYPKKVNKQAAERRWASTTKRVASAEIIAGLRRYVAWWQSKGTDRQFIPGPDAWLNKGCWTDELIDEAPRGSWFPGDGPVASGGDWFPGS